MQDLVGIHNEAFAPLNQSLQQGTANSMQMLEGIGTQQLKQQLYQEKLAADIAAAQEQRDKNAFLFAFKELEDMGKTNPQVQRQMINQITSQPGNKFLQMYQKYSALGDPLGLQGLVGQTPEEKLQQDTAFAEDPKNQDLLARKQAAAGHVDAMTTQALGNDPLVQQAKIDELVRNNRGLAIANAILGKDPEVQQAHVDAGVSSSYVNTRIQETTRAMNLAQAVQKEQDQVGYYKDENGNQVLMTKQQAADKGLLDINGNKPGTRNFKGNPMHDWATALNTYSEERTREEQKIRSGTGIASSGSVAAAQAIALKNGTLAGAGAKVSEEEVRLKLLDFDRRKMPSLVQHFSEAMVTADPDMKDKISQQFQLLDRYIHEPGFRQSDVGKDFYNAMVLAGRGQSPTGDSIPKNPLSLIVKQLPYGKPNGSQEQLTALELYESLNIPNLESSMQEIVNKAQE